VGCLVAVSFGAGCVALTVAPIVPSHPHPHDRRVAHASYTPDPVADEALSAAPVDPQLTLAAASSSRAGATKTASTGAYGRSSTSALTPAAKASREFGLGRLAHQTTAVTQSSAPTARAASADSAADGGSGESASGAGGESHGTSAAATDASPSSSSGGGGGGDGSSAHEAGGPSAAEREFGLG